MTCLKADEKRPVSVLKFYAIHHPLNTRHPYFLRTGRDTAGTYKERKMQKGCIQLITRQIIHVQKTVPNCSANRPYLAAK